MEEMNSQMNCSVNRQEQVAGKLPRTANEPTRNSSKPDWATGELPHDAARNARHEDTPHTQAQFHHHHAHSPESKHTHGHHLLQVDNLSIGFRMYDPDQTFFKAQQKTMHVLNALSVSVHEGEILAIVGASGSGKTLLADTILGLFEPNAQVKGSIWFDGKVQTRESLEALRGHGVSLVPQSVNSLDPLMRVGRQVEGFSRSLTAAQRKTRRKELFSRYGLTEEVARLYPHQLSGGMARRVLLCCALMDNPRLIVADEPTPGLDLPLAARALQDFRSFADAGGGVLLITHDIQLALRVADRIAVFKDGTVVEETAAGNFADEKLLQHPFSKALWRALPEHQFEASNIDAAPASAEAAALAAKEDEPC